MWLGIDFGTCNSSASVMQGWVPSLVRDSRYKDVDSFPTCAYLDPQRGILVGYDAYNQRLRDLSRYKEGFKRELARQQPFSMGESQVFVKQLVVEVIKKFKHDAEKMVGERLARVTLAVPATHSPIEKRLMEEAGKEAGFEHIALVEEPVAAAVYYAQRSCTKDEEILMIYDLGGGTFDASLIQRRGSGYKHLAVPVGMKEGAGIDFDRKIFNHLINECCSDSQRDQITGQNRQAFIYKMTLQESCRQLKENLSTKQKDSFPVPISGGLQIYELERMQFEHMIADDIQESVQQCQELLKRANLTENKVDRILLVGGSSQIPYIQQVLEREFKRPVARLEDPDLAVSKGAAVYEGWNHGYPHLQAGIDRAEVGDYQGAISHYNRALQESPNYARAYVCRGDARCEIGNHKEAIADVEYALQLEPKYADAHVVQASIYSQLGEIKKTIDFLTLALRINPNYIKAYSERGRYRSYEEDSKIASADWQQALKITPQTSEDYTHRAWAYYLLENHEAAQKEVDLALLLNHSYVNAYIVRALIHSKFKNHQAVIDDFNQALRLNSNNPHIYGWRGIYYYSDLEKYDEAIADFDRALKISPNYVFVYNHRGVCRAALGDLAGAIADFSQALSINPNEYEAYCGRGDVRFSQEDYRGALRDYNQALQINKNLPRAYLGRGFAQLNLENYWESKEDFDRVIQSDANLADAYYGRGCARSWLNDFIGTKQDFQQAAKLAQAQGNTTFYKQIQNELSQL